MLENSDDSNNIFFNHFKNEIHQNSFKDYFISIHKEIPDYYKNYSFSHQESEIRRYPNNPADLFTKLLSINVINQEKFITTYTDYIKLIHARPNKIPYFTKFEQNECQLLYLLDKMNNASEKIDYYIKNSDLTNKYTDNHLIKINNIIKSDPELIGYVYILQWLKKIIALSLNEFNENDQIKNIIDDKNPLDGINQDPIEYAKKINTEKMINLIKKFEYTFFQKNISECQIMCNSRNADEFGEIFGGGCPLFDRNIMNEDDLNYFDNDLISPSMFTKDFDDFLELKKGAEDKNVFGNSLYILWYKTIYENADFSDNNTEINTLFRLLSGNYKNYELNENNVYEYLYINILNLLHSKLFYELTKNPKNKMVAYNYIEFESFNSVSNVINNDNRDIFNIINSIIQNENIYNNLLLKNIFISTELEFIKLFFINIQIKKFANDENKMQNLTNYYIENLTSLLNKISEGFDSSQFEYLITNEREFNSISLREKELKHHQFIDMVYVCIYRGFFSALTTYVSINHKFFDFLVDKNKIYNLEAKIEKIYDLLDKIFCTYAKKILSLNQVDDLDLLIYIPVYMFNINNIIYIFTEISRNINIMEKYQELINYINGYFNIKYSDNKLLSTYIIDEITNNSNLLKISNRKGYNINSIDSALEYYIKNKIKNYIEEISDDDVYKINQVCCLFDKFQNEEFNKDTSFSYLLKLLAKFLVNYKFKEAYELKYQLKDFLYEEDSPTDDLIYMKLNNIENIINNNNENDIDFNAKLICRYLFIIILDCFYFYANQILLPYRKMKKNNENNKNIKDNKNEDERIKANCIIFIQMKINNLNKLIKLITGNENIFNDLCDYYSDMQNEFKKLLGDWAFQTIKFVSDIFENNLIDRNSYDSLNLILDFALYNQDMMNKYYLMSGFYNKNNVLNAGDEIFKKEKMLYDIMTSEQKQKCLGLLYKMSKINKSYLSNTLDAKLMEDLNEQNEKLINEMDFDYD